MFKIDLEVYVDRTDYHLTAGGMIDLSGSEVMIDVEDTETVTQRAVKTAFARYYRAARAISSDGP